jgi:RimJ/RimL family protein N-acetyltransferase
MLWGDVRIVDLDEFEPSDGEILSWREMMTAPDQLEWEYDDSWASEVLTTDSQIAEFRAWRAERRGSNHQLWALAGGRVVGMIGINRPADPTRRHCGELGYGVVAAYTRRGIGTRLVLAAIAKARQIGVERLETDCFADNAASIALLTKCGFRNEGRRSGAIRKSGVLRDQMLFGLRLS